MKTKLFELLGISEEKKNLLLLLNDGSKKKETIMESLGISRQALVPHVTLLEQNGLITRQDDSYGLTGIGKITVSEMIPFLETLEFLDNNSSFLGNYNLDFIPPDLLERFHELGSLKVKEPALSEIHEPDKEFMSTVSTSFSLISTFMYPTFSDLTSKLMDRGTDVSVIINKEIFEKLRRERHDECKGLIENENLRVYLYPEDLGFISFGLTDTCVMFRLFNMDNGFDNKTIMSCSPAAVEWGREFFESYLKRSTPVTD
ncbi:MAG: transcriptional regulator FilR1 domain-containing protein [Methanolobus sp.]|nr:transcriptional regulator FilR1 domain-containing protein [Methanolobus sp.]